MRKTKAKSAIIFACLLSVSPDASTLASRPSNSHVAEVFSSRPVRQDTSKQYIAATANVLFNRATRKYEEEQYWQSTIDLIVILDYYPAFQKIEEAIYLLGSCLYKMEIYHASDQIYRYLVKEFPQTQLFPQTMLALQKVHYQKRDYQQSLKFYNALESHYSGNDAIDESRYYAIQAHYHAKNYNIVPNISRLIRKKGDFYSFAMYTEALVHLKKKMLDRL